MIFHENCLLADNSHEISYLIFFETYERCRKICRLLQSRVKFLFQNQRCGGRKHRPSRRGGENQEKDQRHKYEEIQKSSGISFQYKGTSSIVLGYLQG